MVSEPFRTKQKEYLRTLRGECIDPSQHPSWGTKLWLRYAYDFAKEYLLIFIFVIPACIVSGVLGMFDVVKNQWLPNKKLCGQGLKENLTRSALFTSVEKSNGADDTISIIIPCYKESRHIKPTLVYLDMLCSDPSKIEIILVDGDSGDIDDLTKAVHEVEPHLSMNKEQILLVCKKSLTGRGTCQNIGVAHAKGKYLMFIHADTVPPKHYDELVRDSYKKHSNILIGAFSFAIDRSLMPYPLAGGGWVEFFARMRNTFLKLPYGDQCLWITRERFMEVGGFKWIPILDDVELVYRCREIAAIRKQCIYVDPHLAYCSPRRWQKNGVAKNTVWNQWVVFLYTRLNLTPERLYNVYYGRKL